MTVPLTAMVMLLWLLLRLLLLHVCVYLSRCSSKPYQLLRRLFALVCSVGVICIMMTAVSVVWSIGNDGHATAPAPIPMQMQMAGSAEPNHEGRQDPRYM